MTDPYRAHRDFKMYNAGMRELLLLVHPTTGALAIFCTIWFVVEALNASAANRARLRLAAGASFALMFVTWVAGGFWYVVYYPADKAVILAGAWPFAHTFFMEVKEHAFFITLTLSLYLWLIARKEDLSMNRTARALALTVALLVVVSAFAIEGMGSIVSMGVRVGLLPGA